MLELLIVLAFTLVVFSFLLSVLYVHNRRKNKTPHIHTCAHCTCDRKDAPAARDALKRRSGHDSTQRFEQLSDLIDRSANTAD